MGTTEPQIARLLTECASGDRTAADRLFSLVYEDLRVMAHRQLRGEADGHTLNTTALVHEAYLALADRTRSGWRDRAHFLAVASRAMRHILIDYARARLTAKRGGAGIRVALREDLAPRDGCEWADIDLLALEEALVELAQRDERLGCMVECRFFGGMSVEETAEALGVGVRTVERDWTRAKAYLYQQLAE
jgi:RNA polymerase sigma factor (TIGR02999 family)